MIKVSIVVPVYNVEGYIEKCLISLLAQTYSQIEIIVVDDRAKDNSLAIAQRVLGGQSSVSYKIIQREVNGGLSASRNTGLEHAQGQYVIFIDSDDWCEPTMMEEMVQAMETNEVDIVVCNNYACFEDKADKIVVPLHLKGKVSRLTALSALFNIREAPNIWRNMYKVKLFGHIRFDEGVYYEDKLIQPYLWAEAQSLYFLDKPLYNYLIGRKGSITSAVNFAAIAPHFEKIPALLDKLHHKLLPALTASAANTNWKRDLIYYDYVFVRNLLLKFSTQNAQYSPQLKQLFKLFGRHLSFFSFFLLLSKKQTQLFVYLLFFKISPFLFWKKFH